VGAAPSSVGGDGARAQQHGNDADAELGHRFAEFVARSDSSWRRRVRSAQGRACDGMTHDHGDGEAFAEIDRRIHDRGLEIEQHPYLFDRRFLFRVLSMRH